MNYQKCEKNIFELMPWVKWGGGGIGSHVLIRQSAHPQVSMPSAHLLVTTSLHPYSVSDAHGEQQPVESGNGNANVKKSPNQSESECWPQMVMCDVKARGDAGRVAQCTVCAPVLQCGDNRKQKGASLLPVPLPVHGFCASLHTGYGWPATKFRFAERMQVAVVPW